MIGTPPHAIGLAALTETLDGALVQGDIARTIAGLSHDSRTVRPGFAFVALRGERQDGHDFVPKAIAGGAVAVVVELERAASLEIPSGVTLVAVHDTRRALARLAATFYERPSSALAVVGVTGTNGKTTTTFLIEAILEAAGVPCGRIGTLGAPYAAYESAQYAAIVTARLQSRHCVLHRLGFDSTRGRLSPRPL